jgi:hypothetical protein
MMAAAKLLMKDLAVKDSVRISQTLATEMTPSPNEVNE